jgi:short subunit dehydrogenase-like uncharacterized protein
MIYGANGYTGALCAQEAVARGTRPVLAGRNGDTVKAVASQLDLESRVFALDEPAEVARQLDDIDAVLHCAGPFSATARPMLDGCVRSHTHYLDITGEIDIFEHVHQNTATWREAGIVVLPGVGFDVVPTDCLAAMLKRALPDATHLRLAFKSKVGKMSPGTAKTVAESMGQGCRVRRAGEIVRIPIGSVTETIPFRDKPSSAVAIAWGDVSTAFYSTGIPNIEVFMGAPEKQAKQMRKVGRLSPVLGFRPVQGIIKAGIEKRVQGPTAEERAADEVHLYGEVTNAAGEKAAMTLRTPNGYSHTVDAALESVRRVLTQEVTPGAQTPSLAFGPEFVLDLEGVDCERVT